MGSSNADLILVGAGLSNCLLAWFLKKRQPHLHLLILEKAESLPRSRTWSFHRTDVGESYSELAPLIESSWKGHEIRLPNHQRIMSSEYCSLRPETLQKKMQELLGENLQFSTEVKEIGPRSVQLVDGQRLTAACILDGRNLHSWPGSVGYQKFVGLHLELRKPHGLTRPLLMDAQVPQSDGYRFFYVLPWSERELLVEDTRLSARADLDVDLLTTEIEKYASRQSWDIQTVKEREQGVLSLPISAEGFLQAPAHCTGVAGGFFHPVTGYSLPFAVALAERISRLKSFSAESILTEIHSYRLERQPTLKFLCLLNRMMFMAAPPAERYRIFEHFYRLPDEKIERFYSGRLRWDDSLRLLMGKPPVAVSAALRSMFTEGALL